MASAGNWWWVWWATVLRDIATFGLRFFAQIIVIRKPFNLHSYYFLHLVTFSSHRLKHILSNARIWTGTDISAVSPNHPNRASMTLCYYLQWGCSCPKNTFASATTRRQGLSWLSTRPAHSEADDSWPLQVIPFRTTQRWHENSPFAALNSPSAALNSPSAALNSPFAALNSPFAALNSPFAALTLSKTSLRYDSREQPTISTTSTLTRNFSLSFFSCSCFCWARLRWSNCFRSYARLPLLIKHMKGARSNTTNVWFTVVLAQHKYTQQEVK